MTAHHVARHKAIPRRKERGRPIFSLHDAALSQLDDAVDALTADQGDEAVHKARKAAKRSRAALRLLRESLGPGGYHRENRSIRDAAKPLTAVRDAFMLRKALHRMPQRPPALEQGLKSEYLCERRSFKREGLRGALAQLQAARRDLDASSALVPEPASAVQGVRRTYNAGRNARIKAKSGDDEALHEWRKQAKYLLNELELLRDLFGLDVKRLRRRAHKIGDLLGDDHDLSVLSAKMRRYGVGGADLLKHIKRRRRRLQRAASKQGKKLYRHRAKRIEAGLALKLGRST